MKRSLCGNFFVPPCARSPIYLKCFLFCKRHPTTKSPRFKHPPFILLPPTTATRKETQTNPILHNPPTDSILPQSERTSSLRQAKPPTHHNRWLLGPETRVHFLPKAILQPILEDVLHSLVWAACVFLQGSGRLCGVQECCLFPCEYL